MLKAFFIALSLLTAGISVVAANEYTVPSKVLPRLPKEERTPYTTPSKARTRAQEMTPLQVEHIGCSWVDLEDVPGLSRDQEAHYLTLLLWSDAACAERDLEKWRAFNAATTSYLDAVKHLLTGKRLTGSDKSQISRWRVRAAGLVDALNVARAGLNEWSEKAIRSIDECDNAKDSYNRGLCVSIADLISMRASYSSDWLFEMTKALEGLDDEFARDKWPLDKE